MITEELYSPIGAEFASTSSLRSQLLQSLKTSGEYRHAFVEERIQSSLAAQVHTIREQREWDQKKFAEKLGKKVSWVYRLEDPNQPPPTIPSLLEVARAFDIDLEIKFRPFSVFLDDVDRLSSDSLKAASFKDELPEIEARIRQEENMARQRQFFASVQARNAAPAPLEDDSEIAWAGGIGAPLLMQAAGLADVLHDFAIPDLYPDLFAMNALGWNSIASALNATEALYRSVPGSDQNEITGDRTNFVSGERFLRHQEKRHREKAKFKGTDSIIPKEALSA